MINYKNKKSGFTLIELLVVISIIGLLSSVVLSSVASARDKATDAKVVSERHSLQIAIQLFKNQYGRYPNPGDTSLHCLSKTNCVFAGINYSTNFSGELAKLSIPKDENSNQITFIKKASAYINNMLPAALTANPLIQPSVSTYQGPFYQCIDSGCVDVRIIFTTKNAISGLPGMVTGLTGVYEQSADGVAASSFY